VDHASGGYGRQAQAQAQAQQQPQQAQQQPPVAAASRLLPASAGQGGRSRGSRPGYQGPAESTPYAQQLHRRAAAPAPAPAPQQQQQQQPPPQLLHGGGGRAERPSTADLLRKLKAASDLPWEQEDSGGALLFAYVERLAMENGAYTAAETKRLFGVRTHTIAAFKTITCQDRLGTDRRNSSVS
jgi:hypothetical protein